MNHTFKKIGLAACIASATFMMAACNSRNNDDVPISPPPGGGDVELEAHQVAIYYKRSGSDYSDWGVYLWDDIGDDDLAEGVASPDWSQPMPLTGIHETHGAYYIIDLNADRNDNQAFNFIIKSGDNKNCPDDQVYSVSEFGEDVYATQDSCELTSDPAGPPPLLKDAGAHLLNEGELVWDVPAGATTVQILSSEDGSIATDDSGEDLKDYDQRINLEDGGLLESDQAGSYPGFAGKRLWILPDGVDVKSLVKDQLIAAAVDAEGKVLEATRIQFPFALDALFYEGTDLKDAQLGATFAGGNVNIRLWAPTARKVELQLAETEDDIDAEFVAMDYDSETGVWSYSGDEAELNRKFYRYRVEVYHRSTGRVETSLVTDPYSLTVTTNGRFTQVINLDDADLKPAGWDSIVQSRPDDIVVYETHIRDISIFDKDTGNGVNLENNGKFRAFAEPERTSMKHLQSLRASGLTYLQVLPAFDIATVDEDPEKVVDLNDPFSKLCELNPAIKDSEFGADCGTGITLAEAFENARQSGDDKPQALNDYVRMHDSFNWGYDPFHYTAPEGSYAVGTDATDRVLQFREMVKALNDMDIRVAMDVVYNHTNAAGLADKSVLDKIVPDYYQRLNTRTGAVDHMSCCPGTASEQAMMEKLMVESLEVWARDYKIDAFRFDLMGLHTKANMLKVKERLEAINSDMYLYGEGWDMQFESQYGQDAATQLNMCGADIGTFTDRARDAIRGGGPFDGGDDIRKNQGFGSDVWGVLNELNQTPDLDSLLNGKDMIRLGLAGNLKDYSFTNYKGQQVVGSEVDYNGAPAGYTCSPIEVVNYVSKHDNQTLWDNNQYKMAEQLTADERVQMQVLAQVIPVLSQGVPFIHMGAEILRSKSMQRDSYDSGDWYNKVDFDTSSPDWDNNWNVGLPRADKDGDNWDLIRSIVDNDNIVVNHDHAILSNKLVQEYLAIRQSSPLFRLETLGQVQEMVKFHNTGETQNQGVIVMELDDTIGVDPQYQSIVVMINATAEEQKHGFAKDGYTLHPVQLDSASDVVKSATFESGEFVVPARTVSVFVK